MFHSFQEFFAINQKNIYVLEYSSNEEYNSKPI